MHDLHCTVAQLVIQDRIRDAEARRAGRDAVRARRAATGGAGRHGLRSLVHPRPALARMWRPE